MNFEPVANSIMLMIMVKFRSLAFKLVGRVVSSTSRSNLTLVVPQATAVKIKIQYGGQVM